MHTIDTLIERLTELKKSASGGGKTRIAIVSDGRNYMRPPVLVEITAGTFIDGICGTAWEYTAKNDTELVRIV